MAVQPNTIFQKAAEMGASDVHIAVDAPVIFRINGTLTPISKGNLSAADVKKILTAVLGAAQYKVFEEKKEVDVSYAITKTLRIRANCHFEKGNPGMVARLVPQDIPTLEDINMEEIADDLCNLREGLILFTGPTGAGKSTSLAAMINAIRSRRPVNVVTLEDPIEFLFPQSKESGVIRQRQYGEDFTAFDEALKRVLRQDPDIVMVGEMRDVETIAAALTLAETGHLVFATLHTPNTTQTIDRIVDVFPSHQQQQIRSQLSLSLKAIISQRLLPAKDGGRVSLREMLINTPAVANIIRENRLQELTSILQVGSKDGMFTFEADLKRLKKEGRITTEVYDQIIDTVQRGKKAKG